MKRRRRFRRRSTCRARPSTAGRWSCKARDETADPVETPDVRAAAWRQALGGRARTEGHASEWIAALWLMLKGYQILGFRLKSRAGEIDILARRGRVLAVVEVKRRATLDAALAAVTDEQHLRLLCAGRALLHGRPSLAGHELRIDMVALAPKRFPRHLREIGRKGGHIS